MDIDKELDFGPGDQLGKYRLEEPIGRGGMGMVFRATDTVLERPAAVKILYREISNRTDFQEQFKREARTLATLQHPNIVTVYDLSKENSHYFISMEYVEGPTLKTLIKNKSITKLEKLNIVEQICEGLQYAHNNDIIHLDVKPKNILISEGNTPKIADFGIARLIAGDHDFGEEGKVYGSKDYMAPERIQEMADVDHRADIFSLGVLIENMIGDPEETGEANPQKGQSDLSSSLNSILEKATDPDPDNRYQNLNAMKKELEPVIRQLKEQSTSLNLPVVFRTGFNTYRSHPVKVLSASLMAVLGTILSLGILGGAMYGALADCVLALFKKTDDFSYRPFRNRLNQFHVLLMLLVLQFLFVFLGFSILLLPVSALWMYAIYFAVEDRLDALPTLIRDWHLPDVLPEKIQEALLLPANALVKSTRHTMLSGFVPALGLYGLIFLAYVAIALIGFIVSSFWYWVLVLPVLIPILVLVTAPAYLQTTGELSRTTDPDEQSTDAEETGDKN